MAITSVQTVNANVIKKKRYMIQNTYIAEQYLILKCKRVGTEGSNPAFEFLSI